MYHVTKVVHLNCTMLLYVITI